MSKFLIQQNSLLLDDGRRILIPVPSDFALAIIQVATNPKITKIIPDLSDEANQ